MSVNFDKALGIHQHALKIRDERAKLLANNLANSDTPGFKAKDINFKEVLGNMTQANAPGKIDTTNKGHISVSDNISANEFNTKYRVPSQPSTDGNTVDGQQEVAAFSENAMRYMATLRFLDGRFKGLMSAIRGE